MKCTSVQGGRTESFGCKTKWGVHAIVYSDLQTLLSFVFFLPRLFSHSFHALPFFSLSPALLNIII